MPIEIREVEPDGNVHPFLKWEDGYIKNDFYKTDDVTERDASGKGRFLVSSLFFPSSYEKNIGKDNPVYCPTVAGVSEFRPLLSSRLIDFLETQGPGCTDMQIPLKTVIDGVVYVYTDDGISGSTILTCPEAEWDKHEALRQIENFHLEDWDPDDDEEW